MRRLGVWLPFFLFVLGGCPALRTDPIGAGSSPDGGTATPDDGTPENDGVAGDPPNNNKTDGGSSPIRPLGTYDDEQKALEAKRFPGPITAQGSRGVCTGTHFVWRDGNGALHSWNGQTKAKTDYTVTTIYRPFWQPSDSWLVTEANGSDLGIHKLGVATDPSPLSMGYAFHYASADNGVIRFDGRIGNTQLAGRKVRRWLPNGAIEDISAELDTQQPPMSFDNDEAVIPSSVNVPHALYIVNVAKKTTVSVTFDGGTSIRQTLATPRGLLVSYARSGPKSALRLYKNNQDTTREEIGDELANRPNVFKDTTAIEHALVAHIASFGTTVFYDSAIGIWAYDVLTATLTPVQLGVNKTIFVPDTMCVLPKAGLLMYRLNGDTVGQVWAVPINSVLPQ